MDAILEGAARVFAEQGFAAGTTNRIAERAGVSVGSLYEYFPNKESILVALVERTTDQGMARIEGRLEEDSEGDVDLGRLLLGFVEAMLAFHRREPELHRVLFEEAPHPPELHACVLQMEEKLAQHADLQRRAAEGEAVTGGGEVEMSREECEQLMNLGYVTDCSHIN